jgi:hypothetical protein
MSRTSETDREKKARIFHSFAWVDAGSQKIFGIITQKSRNICGILQFALQLPKDPE